MLDLLRLSQIGQCPRKIGYHIQTDTPIIRVQNQRMVDGIWHEYEVKLRLYKMGATFELGFPSRFTVQWPLLDGYIYGHPDGIVVIPDGLPHFGLYTPGGRYLLEVKSMSEGMWWQFVKKGLRVSHPHYFDQVQGYMDSSENMEQPIDEDELDTMFHQMCFEAGEEIQELVYNYEPEHPLALKPVIIPTQSLVVAKNKTSGDLRFEVVPYDEDYTAGLRQRWESANVLVEDGLLPGRPYTTPKNWECRECPFIEPCWNISNEE